MNRTKLINKDLLKFYATQIIIVTSVTFLIASNSQAHPTPKNGSSWWLWTCDDGSDRSAEATRGLARQTARGACGRKNFVLERQNGPLIEIVEEPNAFILFGDIGTRISQLGYAGITLPVDHIFRGAAIRTNNNDGVRALLSTNDLVWFPPVVFGDQLLVFPRSRDKLVGILSEEEILIESSEVIHTVFIEKDDQVELAFEVLASTGGEIIPVDYIPSLVHIFTCSLGDSSVTGHCCSYMVGDFCAPTCQEAINDCRAVGGTTSF